MLYPFLRSLLFCLPEEFVHHLSLSSLDYIPSCCFKKPEEQPVEVMGLKFPHRIGLAAGLDKNGKYIKGLSKLGFAFIELGSITPKPQPGNPKPRLFRIPEAEAIINRMGFNNEGVDALVAHVVKSHYQGILGINLGKNKSTPLESSVNDYCIGLNTAYPYASYVTINISSPNTKDLRVLQEENYLSALIKTLKKEQARLADHYQRKVPLVIKLSPDEKEEDIKRIAHDLVSAGIEGIIATNTTVDHSAVHNYPHGQEEGGLSGRPLFHKATESLRIIKSVVGNDLALIAAGGIDSKERAEEKLKAGASLLQVYTGLIYQGPRVVHLLDS